MRKNEVGTMRIISGRARGKTIKAPKGMKTRPTTDRVREAIFSTLSPYLDGAVVLDAFAGSGALGLEAISRGAEMAVFCEQDRHALAVIRENISLTGFVGRARVLSGATEQLLQNCSGFDIVLLDPPYNRGLIGKVEPILLREGFLNEDALVMLETASKEPELFTDSRWLLYKSRVFGDTAVYYYGLQAE
jgi:16S rRNA (guanine(966)-N(2))-methyltransferase RsmD